MRAAAMREQKLVVKDVEEPTPGPGQVLVETLACGICGSDLHVLQRGEIGSGEESPIDPNRDLVMGHEFSARVLELGPGVDNLAVGNVVTSIPIVLVPGGMATIGYSHDFPGGYGERMVLMAAICLKVPDGLDPAHAALTEPLAVGRHAANLGKMTDNDGAIVIGCGPIGLAIISALSLDGYDPIIASDFSSARRDLAGEMGAHHVVNPNDEPPIEAWGRVGGVKNPVIYEAVGVPGTLDQAMRMAPRSGRIVVAGVCMDPDTITPMVGIGNELNIQFALGYTPEEFSATLDSIAAGHVDAAKLITAQVGLDELPEAFEMLAKPDEHVKIIVTPNAR